MSEPDQREEAVFEAALQLPVGERAAYLDQTCAGDADLRRRVEVLLGAFERAGGFLKQPAVTRSADSPTLLIPPTEKAGDRIGRYKLLQQIGEGGCGIVYMAEQVEPVRRRVALKVIKLGMDTKSVIARFEAERQALALMDHPNIAKVLDAGATDTGRPYFVMELVHGIKITDYCDQNNLPTRERLDLFVLVCQAIQHAHQKGVIHRDIKPSNILVTSNDGVPMPKVIDFGIAKATQQPLTDKTLFTAFEQFIGTPAYMSPEQAEMNASGIDTRSDIYSLGVLLYELLTSQTPFDSKALLQAGLDGIRQIIREQEPVRPSTRLSTMLAGELTTTARHRHAEPPKLIRLVRGELDWIVMKAMEKDRSRRYETANGFAKDVQRYLADEPVVACPPSAVYRFQKLFRRNKLAFAAAGAVVAALLIGLAVSTWLLFQEKAARQRAVAAETKAHTEASKSQQVAEFLKKMIQGVGPSTALGRDTKMLREILDKTAEHVGRDLKDQPEVEAELRFTIGEVYWALDENDKAEKMHRQALALRRKFPGDDNALVATSINRLVWVLFSQGSMTEAESLSREALAMRRRLLGGEHPDLASSLNTLAQVLGAEGRLDEAEPLQRQALAMYRKLFGDDNREVTVSLNNLAKMLVSRGKASEAELLSRDALRIRRKLFGNEHAEVATSVNDLALILYHERKLVESEALRREGLEIRRKVFGNEHSEVANSLNDLALILYHERKLVESEALMREALAMRRKLLGEANRHVAQSLSDLADGLTQEGRLDDVEALYRDALSRQRSALGSDNPTVVATLCGLADCLTLQGKLEAARKLHREVLGIIPKLRAEDLVKLPLVPRRLAELLHSQGQALEAEKLYEEIILLIRKSSGESSPTLAYMLHNFANFLFYRENKPARAAEHYLNALSIRYAITNDELTYTLRELGGALLATGKPKQAEPYLRDALAIYHKLHREEDVWGSAATAASLADALYQQDRLPEAEQSYREALVAYSKCRPLDSQAYVHTVQSLVGVLTAGKQPFDKAALYSACLQGLRAQLPTDDPTLADVLAQFTSALIVEGNFTGAEPLARDCLAIREKKLPDDWRTFNTRSMVGGCLLGQKKYAAAEPLLLSGYEGLKQREDKIPPAGKARLPQAIQRLVQFYEETNRPEQAAEWKTKLAAPDKAQK